VCQYCQSVLIRHDVDLGKVGEVSTIPDDASPIQMGTEGIYADNAFHVVGRIVYEYEHGRWNEWHLIFNNGQSGWLSDAQLEYAVSFLMSSASLPALTSVSRDNKFQWNEARYQVTSITQAHYVGVEGELPFEYWDKHDLTFVDLRSHDSRFATVDYSENPPLLFLGYSVQYEYLRLKNIRQFEGWQ
jgi:hypothetical protein